MEPERIQYGNFEKKSHWVRKILYTLLGLLILVVIGGSVYWWQEIKERSLATVDQYLEEQELKNNAMADWKDYINIDYGFQFKYPKDWSVINENNEIGLISPELTEGQINSETNVSPFDIGIVVRPVSGTTTIEGFVKNYQKGWYEVYESKKNIFIDNHSAIEYSDEKAMVNHSPLIATFVQDKNRMIIVHLGYGDSTMIGIYNQILSTFKFADSQKDTVNSLQVGQTVAGMKVVSIAPYNKNSALSDTNATVVFSGEKRLTGKYQSYRPDSDFGNNICFESDLKTSTLPLNDGNDKRGFFCFDDRAEAAEKLYVTDVDTGSASIIVDKYTAVFCNFCPAYDSAHLLKVIEID